MDVVKKCCNRFYWDIILDYDWFLYIVIVFRLWSEIIIRIIGMFNLCYILGNYDCFII